MEELILYDSNRHKKQIIRDCIEFDCAVGRNAYSDNDFILKTPFNKNELFEIGEWVSYGYTEYGGIIRSRVIDVGNNIVTYTGSSFRGVLANQYVWSKTSYNPDYDGFIEDTPANCFNRIFEDNPLFDATSDIETTAQVGTYSTSGLMTTNGLYIHDNIIKKFTTVEGRPVKSRFKLQNGVITIDFLYGSTLYFDSSKTRLKYDERKNTPNACFCETRKTWTDDYGYLLVGRGVAYLTADGNISEYSQDWVAYNDPSNAIIMVTESTGESGGIAGDYGVVLNREARDRLLEAQEKPATEIEIDTEEAEVDDIIVASISELQMKVTKKVVESRLKISNGIPKITYTLEG